MYSAPTLLLNDSLQFVMRAHKSPKRSCNTPSQVFISPSETGLWLPCFFVHQSINFNRKIKKGIWKKLSTEG